MVNRQSDWIQLGRPGFGSEEGQSFSAPRFRSPHDLAFIEYRESFSRNLAVRALNRTLVATS